jgi:hypothetical protein
MIDGELIKIGEKEYTVPALNFKRVRTVQKLLEEIGTVNVGQILTDKQLDMMIEITHIGIQRNYPEMTKEELEENLDLNNIFDVVQAVTGQTGLKKRIAKESL